MSEIKDAKIYDLKPDDHNANRGTLRGMRALNHSLSRYGAGRSILIDKNGRIIAGNKTIETAADLGLEDLILVPTDGTKIVAVQRTDLDLETDPRARELAYADNRVGELDLDWDPEIVRQDEANGIDLSAFFNEEELDSLTFSDTDDESQAQEYTLLDQAVQLQPAREYIVVMCEDPSEFDELKRVLALPQVRRGGYKSGSPFDAVGTQRVILAADILRRLNDNRDPE